MSEKRVCLGKIVGVHGIRGEVKVKSYTAVDKDIAAYGELEDKAAGKRFSLPNSRIMIHQPSGGARGMASDIEIQAAEILRMRKMLNGIYVKHTGQKLAAVEKAVDRDNFMSPEEAKKFGLIDEIVVSRSEIIK